MMKSRTRYPAQCVRGHLLVTHDLGHALARHPHAEIIACLLRFRRRRQRLSPLLLQRPAKESVASCWNRHHTIHPKIVSPRACTHTTTTTHHTQHGQTQTKDTKEKERTSPGGGVRQGWHRASKTSRRPATSPTCHKRNGGVKEAKGEAGGR